MNFIFHLERPGPADWDEYSDCVVIAENEEKARLVPPADYMDYPNQEYSSWVKPEKLKVTLIGKAHSSMKPNTCICASFHAG